MDTDDLIPEQAKKIYDALGTALNYLARLKRRIDGNRDQLDRFLQSYAVEKAKLEARRKGHSC